jgi:hypothetical protein
VAHRISRKEQGWKRVTGRRPRLPSAAMAAGTSSLSSTETALPATVPEAEGMGEERREKGSRLGDSRHGRASGRGSAPSSHGYGSGSSWGALLRQGRRRSRLGEGRGGCGGAHRRRNRAKMAWLGRSTVAFVTLFLGKTKERGRR